GVPDDGGLLVERADDVAEVVGDLADRLAGEDLGVLLGLADRLGVVGPAGGDGDVAGLLEDAGPAIPAAGQQPQAVDEDDGLKAALVGALDLLGLARRDVLGGVGHGPATLPSGYPRAAILSGVRRPKGDRIVGVR